MAKLVMRCTDGPETLNFIGRQEQWNSPRKSPQCKEQWPSTGAGQKEGWGSSLESQRVALKQTSLKRGPQVESRYSVRPSLIIFYSTAKSISSYIIRAIAAGVIGRTALVRDRRLS